MRRLPTTGLIAAAALFASGARGAPAESWTEPVTGIQFVRLEPGTFTMGSPANEAGREPGETRHEVVLTRAFFLGTFEVTQKQWRRVMGSNPSAFAACGDDCPVERVSFEDVKTFLGKLETLTGIAFRLPTEAEWEYACRAGGTAAYSTGAALHPADANFDARELAPGARDLSASKPGGEFRASTMRVGSFPPNAWGLHDMHGNVWEWTADDLCPYPAGRAVDPVGRCASGLKVIRGGSWAFDAASARCALRYTHRPQDSGYSLGFRLARDAGK